MAEIAADARYTEEHEWAREEADGVRIGISDYAQTELGDIVFVELPEVGKSVKKGEVLATIESVKAASEVYAPIDGTVSSVNEALVDGPETVNSAPFGDGWLALLAAEDKGQLETMMDSATYEKFVAEISK